MEAPSRQFRVKYIFSGVSVLKLTVFERSHNSGRTGEKENILLPLKVKFHLENFLSRFLSYQVSVFVFPFVLGNVGN